VTDDDLMTHAHFKVPYLPFVDAANLDLGGFPDYIRRYLEVVRVYPAPDAASLAKAESILRLYISDLEWLILPETHADKDGYTFTNLSYYTKTAGEEALSEYFDGISRATVSLGVVRQLAGIAHACWQALVPLVSRDKPAASKVHGLDAQRLLAGDQTVDASAFRQIITPYPRLLGFNPDHEGDTDDEFILFGDMLRFVWCHEWVHGLAGHSQKLRKRFGVSRFGEMEPAESGSETAHLRRALEFEADAVSVDILITQIFRGEDIPGRLVSFEGDLGFRVALFVLAISFMATHWSELERKLTQPNRSHPPAALRYLRVWGMARQYLVDVARTEDFATFSGVAAPAIFMMAEVVPAFMDLERVTPVVARTPSMSQFEAEMLEYHQLINHADLIRHGIDESVRDVLPDRSP
jgi:hypothetical protein